MGSCTCLGMEKAHRRANSLNSDQSAPLLRADDQSSTPSSPSNSEYVDASTGYKSQRTRFVELTTNETVSISNPTDTKRPTSTSLLGINNVPVITECTLAGHSENAFIDASVTYKQLGNQNAVQSLDANTTADTIPNETKCAPSNDNVQNNQMTKPPISITPIPDPPSVSTPQKTLPPTTSGSLLKQLLRDSILSIVRECAFDYDDFQLLLPNLPQSHIIRSFSELYVHLENVFMWEKEENTNHNDYLITIKNILTLEYMPRSRFHHWKQYDQKVTLNDYRTLRRSSILGTTRDNDEATTSKEPKQKGWTNRQFEERHPGNKRAQQFRSEIQQQLSDEMQSENEFGEMIIAVEDESNECSRVYGQHTFEVIQEFCPSYKRIRVMMEAYHKVRMVAVSEVIESDHYGHKELMEDFEHLQLSHFEPDELEIQRMELKDETGEICRKTICQQMAEHYMDHFPCDKDRCNGNRQSHRSGSQSLNLESTEDIIFESECHRIHHFFLQFSVHVALFMLHCPCCISS